MPSIIGQVSCKISRDSVDIRMGVSRRGSPADQVSLSRLEKCNIVGTG